MIIDVTREALDLMRRAAQGADPYEACGLLLGSREQGALRVTHTVEARNTHPRPRTHFEIDPKTLIEAFRAEREGGLALIGYFHSHPYGAPAPSATDQDMAPGDGRIWAIAARDEVRFWCDKPDGFAPVAHHVVEL